MMSQYQICWTKSSLPYPISAQVGKSKKEILDLAKHTSTESSSARLGTDVVNKLVTSRLDFDGGLSYMFACLTQDRDILPPSNRFDMLHWVLGQSPLFTWIVEKCTEVVMSHKRVLVVANSPWSQMIICSILLKVGLQVQMIFSNQSQTERSEIVRNWNDPSKHIDVLILNSAQTAIPTSCPRGAPSELEVMGQVYTETSQYGEDGTALASTYRLTHGKEADTAEDDPHVTVYMGTDLDNLMPSQNPSLLGGKLEREMRGGTNLDNLFVQGHVYIAWDTKVSFNIRGVRDAAERKIVQPGREDCVSEYWFLPIWNENRRRLTSLTSTPATKLYWFGLSVVFSSFALSLSAVQSAVSGQSPLLAAVLDKSYSTRHLQSSSGSHLSASFHRQAFFRLVDFVHFTVYMGWTQNNLIVQGHMYISHKTETEIVDELKTTSIGSTMMITTRTAATLASRSIRPSITPCHPVVIRAGVHNKTNRYAPDGTILTYQDSYTGKTKNDVGPADWHFTVYMGYTQDELIIQGHIYVVFDPSAQGGLRMVSNSEVERKHVDPSKGCVASERLSLSLSSLRCFGAVSVCCSSFLCRSYCSAWALGFYIES
ncbi:hypothetical protein B0T20DRAFT_390701 [Sordaria brevicollis]|uniref:Uncharacterized protein n=1 Tax=Sordaria brevicollis TaxID=83679 RepID=A0AAE0PJ91_SORBR|nr:hypothetical protein B0T20DRAFT_390701 [Sordaria brevicollis]